MARDLPVSASAEPAGLGVDDAFASVSPPPAAPEVEQHHGADQFARGRRCGHDHLPSESLRWCSSMVIRVVARSAGLGTYFVIGDCVSCRGRTFPQDDCVLVPVVCDRTQSSCRKYVLDGAHGRRPCAAILGWFRQGLLYERSGECRRVGPQIVDVTQIGGVVAVVEVGLESRVALCRLRPHVAD